MAMDYIKKDVRAAAILTTSYVAGTVLENTQEYNQLVLYVDFTKGSLTSAELKVEFSPDNTNWYQETVSSVTGGVDSVTALVHQWAANAADRIMIPIKDRYIRVSVKGTGTVTSSSMAVSAILGET